MTVSKELAKRLVDAGIVVESELYWIIDSRFTIKMGLKSNPGIHFDKPAESNLYDYIPAPNSDELLAVFPEFISGEELFTPLIIKKEWVRKDKRKGYSVFYCGGVIKDSFPNKPIFNESLPEALGLLALKLAEAGLLEGANV